MTFHLRCVFIFHLRFGAVFHLRFGDCPKQGTAQFARDTGRRLLWSYDVDVVSIVDLTEREDLRGKQNKNKTSMFGMSCVASQGACCMGAAPRK
jgi:hypothetical protein